MIEPFRIREVPKIKYQPITQQSTLLKLIRIRLGALPIPIEEKETDEPWRDILVSEGYLYSIRNPTEEEEKYECYQYVLAKTLGFKNNNVLMTLENTQLSSSDPFKYLKQTNTPKLNDFMIYSLTKDMNSYTHFAIFLGHDKGESKLGHDPHIAIHKLFYLPLQYGNYLTFWTLKNKFRKLPQDLLIKLMDHDNRANYCSFMGILLNELLDYYSKIASMNASDVKEFMTTPPFYVNYRR